MAKQIYNESIGRSTDWGGDQSTGGLPVSGQRVQEYIKGEIEGLERAIASVPVVEVDQGLDPESTNAVANAAVAARLAEIEAGTVFAMDFETNDDETAGVLSLRSKTGLIAECEIPIGSGGGGGDTEATSIKVSAQVSSPSVAEGGSVQLTYRYDCVYSAGDDKGQSTGQPANLTVSVAQGADRSFSQTLGNQGCGTYSMDITPYLKPGNNDVYVKAEFYDAQSGRTRSKQAFATVKVVAIHLDSDFTLTPSLQSCGYSGSVSIPFNVRGSGTKSVLLYIDGEQRAVKTVAASNANDNFVIDVTGLSAGAHSVQMVAKLTADGTEYTSESVWLSLLRSGASALAGVVLRNTDGVVITGSGHMTPRLSVKAFEECLVRYGAFSTSGSTADVTVLIDGATDQSVSVGRTQQTLSRRFTSEGSHTLTVRCEGFSQDIAVTVTQGSVSIQEAATALVCKLSAAGRSNTEANPGVWTSGGVSTAFEGVDWSSSGWTGTALRLINGAKATVGIRPFAVDNGVTGAKANGLTIEATLTVQNIVDESAPIMHCLKDGKGLRVMGNEIAMLTGQTITYTDEDGQEQTRESKLKANYVEGRRMKVTLVVRKATDSQGRANRVMELYIDGNRAGADTYEQTYSFAQSSPAAQIVFDSTGADIELELLRVYERALSDDEVLMNDIFDEKTSARIVERYNDNDILNADNEVDINSLLQKGKGVIKIVRQGKLADVYATNDKSTDFTADVYYYSPEGPQRNFTLTGCNIRIQGTSSTKYPSKNIRFYLSKGPNGSTPVLTVGGQVSTNNKYSLRPGAPAMNLFTAKSDYSDSSMSLNTGGAKLFNQCMLDLDLLTPPQRAQRAQGMAVNIRQAIDGVPVDMFAADTVDSTPEYMGQYNLNNEKSKSDALFGMSAVGSTTWACPIALECLNNLQPLSLFQSGSNLESELDANFDSAFEFNSPEDVFWSPAKVKDPAKQRVATATEKQAIRSLMQFVAQSKPAGARADDLSTWQSDYFRQHVAEHFDVQHLLTYYLWTDFFVSVDQRAKNIIWRTWDGVKWYATYYDGDTQRGKRNDSFMVYGPDTDRDTWDSERQKYAFEGHDSWLWNLCLANLQTELATAAANLRQWLTLDRTLGMLLEEQSGNWSDRAFNKSGELKYITPAIRLFPEGAPNAKLWPFIFALQGADRSHSEWFIRERWKLLDAKYSIGEFTSDDLAITLSRQLSDPTDYIGITGARVYAYGYGTNNVPKQYTTGIVQAGVPVSMPVTIALNANDPLRVYGASRIRKLDLRGCCSRIQGSFDVAKAALLEEIDASVPAGKQASQNWFFSGLGFCGQLRVIDVTGQTDASTTAASLVLDLSGLTRMTTVKAKGTRLSLLTLEPGAAVSHLELPETLTDMTLHDLHHLTMAGIDIDSYSSVRSMSLRGCERLDTKALVSAWLADVASADSLSVEGVEWTMSDASLLADIAAKVTNVSMRGHVRVNGPVTVAETAALKAKFGYGCFVQGGAELYIEAAASDVVMTAAHPLTASFRSAGLTGGNDYLTLAQAQAIGNTAISGVNFGRNGALDDYTFDEFRYFTSVTSTTGINFGTQIVGVVFPGSVTQFNAQQLKQHQKLKYVVLEEGVTSLPDEFADYCNALERVELPSTLTALGGNTFYNNPMLKNVSCRAVTPPTCPSKYTFSGAGSSVSGQKLLRVPAQSSEAYRTATGWSELVANGFTVAPII